MNRRSITLYPAVETSVRGFQARLLTKLDRDVSFTEALNLMLLIGCIESGHRLDSELDLGLVKTVLDDTNIGDEALLDNLRDRFFSQALQPEQQIHQPGR